MKTWLDSLLLEIPEDSPHYGSSKDAVDDFYLDFKVWVDIRVELVLYELSSSLILDLVKIVLEYFEGDHEHYNRLEKKTRKRKT